MLCEYVDWNVKIFSISIPNSIAVITIITLPVNCSYPVPHWPNKAPCWAGKKCNQKGFFAPSKITIHNPFQNCCSSLHLNHKKNYNNEIIVLQNELLYMLSYWRNRAKINWIKKIRNKVMLLTVQLIMWINILVHD